MKNTLRILGIGLGLAIILIIAFPYLMQANNKDIKLTVHVSGVHKTKISLIPLSEARRNPLAVLVAVYDGNSADFTIQERHLPGEFMLKFEYYQNESVQRPEISEKLIILNNYSTEFFANPIYVNNLDSSYFIKEDRENNALTEFTALASKNLDMLDLLQNFLLKYDNQDSEFYRSGIEEFNVRRKEHNDWITSMLNKNEALFVANLFRFYFVPHVNWEGDAFERRQSLMDNYFSGMDFSNPDLLKVSYLRNWMDAYVNQYVELAQGPEMIQYYFVAAGQNAIESVKTGHPDVYGWMVDYFFNGYESMDIQEGIQMLAPYIADPNCRTQKRKEIERRLTGIETLAAGADAPDFNFRDEADKKQSFKSYKTDVPYKLVLFWSADCSHCVQMAQQVHKWHEQNKDKIEIFALSLDETETEIPKWERMKSLLPGWVHILTEGGINSKEANAYYILSTPTMFVVDAKTNKIIAAPSNLNQLVQTLE
jgi:peroxiredoxin